MPRKRFWISLLTASAALLLVNTALSLAAKSPKPEPDVVKLLPKSGYVKGWEVYPDTLVYGSGKGLTDIYNGGYELYTKNGALDAAQQIYRCKNDTAIITVHRMESIRAGTRFFQYWKKSDKKERSFKPLRVLTDCYVYTADGAASGYLIRNRYFVTASVYMKGESGGSAAEAFLKDISVKIGKLVQPAKPRK